jgi:hypothetical protein
MGRVYEYEMVDIPLSRFVVPELGGFRSSIFWFFIASHPKDQLPTLEWSFMILGAQPG